MGTMGWGDEEETATDEAERTPEGEEVGRGGKAVQRPLLGA